MKVFATGLDINDHMPFLAWLTLSGVTVFALAAAWHFGAIQFMVHADRSRLTLVILALYIVFSLHCMMLTLRISTGIPQLALPG